MASEGADAAHEAAGTEPAPPAGPPVRRGRVVPLLVLAGAAIVAAYVGARAPRDQHVRFVLGSAAAEVRGLDVQYVAPDGETARETHLTFDPGRAPRVVPHDPALPDGDYRLRIEVDTRTGRRNAERQVTLQGGTTSVDLARMLEP